MESKQQPSGWSTREVLKRTGLTLKEFRRLRYSVQHKDVRYTDKYVAGQSLAETRLRLPSQSNGQNDSKGASRSSSSDSNETNPGGGLPAKPHVNNTKTERSFSQKQSGVRGLRDVGSVDESKPCFPSSPCQWAGLSVDTVSAQFLSKCQRNYQRWWGMHRFLVHSILRPVVRKWVGGSHTDLLAALDIGKMFLLSRKQLAILLTRAVETFVANYLPERHASGKVREYLAHIEGSVYVDVGAGCGDITEELCKMFKNTVCTEASKGMVKSLQSKGFHAIHTLTCAGLWDKISSLLKQEASVGVVSLFNVLDRCDRPFSLLKDLLLCGSAVGGHEHQRKCGEKGTDQSTDSNSVKSGSSSSIKHPVLYVFSLPLPINPWVEISHIETKDESESKSDDEPSDKPREKKRGKQQSKIVVEDDTSEVQFEPVSLPVIHNDKISPRSKDDSVSSTAKRDPVTIDKEIDKFISQSTSDGHNKGSFRSSTSTHNADKKDADACMDPNCGHDHSKWRRPCERLVECFQCAMQWKFVRSVRHFVSKILEPCGYTVLVLSRVPYLSQGDSINTHYALDCAVVVCVRSCDLPPGSNTS